MSEHKGNMPARPWPPGLQELGSGWAALRDAPTDASIWLSLAKAYAAAALPWQAHYAATQGLRCDPGLSGQAQACLACLPSQPDACWEGGTAVLSSVRWQGRAAAAAVLESVTAAVPGDWLSWLYLARCRDMVEDEHAGTRQAVLQAIALEPIAGESGHLLGQWRLAAGLPQAAQAALAAALRQAPQRHGSWLLLGQALIQLGEADGAQLAFERAGASQNPAFLAMLAQILFENNYWEQALAVRQAVTQLRPEAAQSWCDLGLLQSRVWQSEAARASFLRALEVAPGDALARQQLEALDDALDVRASFERKLARLEESIAAGSLAPDSAATLMASLSQDQLQGDAVADLHKRVGQAWEATIERPALPAFRAAGAVSKRLRIGYVSGDLHRQHPVNLFMLPILQRHDHAQFEVFVYHNGTMHDEYTRQAQACADHWREIRQLDDATVARLIRADGIDVLVDLAGHTATHRMPVFAMRAAPVQMTYLGYPHSTGLGCMDWLIADAVVAPPEHAHLYTEKLARLDGSVFCWAPTDDYPLAATPPAVLKGPVVFGSFNGLQKLNSRTLALWGQVLAAVPDSRLLVKAPALKDPALLRHTQERMRAAGIADDRVEYRGPSELGLMMQEYHDVHIALDPLPYNGGTTSLQALWMGCPLVTLTGDNFVSRMGTSFVKAIGAPEWAAQTEEQYVKAAKTLAAQMRKKAWDRQALRERLRSSPAGDIAQHTRQMEASYRHAWQTYCESATA